MRSIRLGKTIAPLASAEPPPQPETTPTFCHSQQQAQQQAQPPSCGEGQYSANAGSPVRLEIAPAPALPELPPLQLAAVRTALAGPRRAGAGRLPGAPGRPARRSDPAHFDT